MPNPIAPNPIAVRFGTSPAQEQAHARLKELLKKAEGHNGVQGMGTLIREIVIKYLPLAEQEFVPFAGCHSDSVSEIPTPVTQSPQFKSPTSNSLTLEMPEWD